MYPKQFQPALPLRGVTNIAQQKTPRIVFQPTLPVRGVTQHIRQLVFGGIISTHTPRAGSDVSPVSVREGNAKFQPTLPVRGVTASAL